MLHDVELPQVLQGGLHVGMVDHEVLLAAAMPFKMGLIAPNVKGEIGTVTITVL